MIEVEWKNRLAQENL